jgi:UDP-N-acetylmuramate dehydrogenase
MNWVKAQAFLQHNAPVAKYTAGRMGGRAEWLYVARVDTTPELLIAIVQAAWSADVPVRVIGGGANILVSDRGVPGLVVVNRLAALHAVGDCQFRVTSGYGIQALARNLAQRGCTGFEWAVSVPGTIGGAVVNNAGAHDGDMSQCVVNVSVVDALYGALTLTVEDMAYEYRTSALKRREDRRCVVTEAVLQFAPGEPDAIEKRMSQFQLRRSQTQPKGASLGSVFKNPPGDFAGRLIESCGLKGFAVGTACVSDVHANFFVNLGDASSDDYYALIRHVQRVVHERHGIWLEPEIELVGVWP